MNHRLLSRGFTLLELLVAITVLSIVSMIAWRGLDSLVATR
ncbi:MAG TPA: prepilin-type N-terminal cleavage/methylation domain-containing protein, partial [Burkholderiaceae bacterium]|nr:prepilin-type N-terminal cleavage/methylation domain-containing protein [Burkholderiaceae bacterium]